jgi:DNA-binding transcriptional ArsR family regulator
MSRLLPFQSDTELPEDREPRVVDLDGEDAERVFGALSSETAREIFTALHEEPMTASDIADAVDSSIQNVRYHLENLADAGLVEVVDTWYSSRGNEMKVYAPRDGPLIVSSDETTASRLRTALGRIVGGGAVLAAASFLVQLASSGIDFGLTGAGSQAPGGADTNGAAPAGDDGVKATAEGDDAAPETTASSTESTDGGDVGVQEATTKATESARTAEPTAASTEAPTVVEEPTAEPTVVAEEPTGTGTADPEAMQYAADTVHTTVDAMTATDGGGGLLAGGIPPGALFFLGGFVVLLAIVAIQYRSATYP